MKLNTIALTLNGTFQAPSIPTKFMGLSIYNTTANDIEVKFSSSSDVFIIPTKTEFDPGKIKAFENNKYRDSFNNDGIQIKGTSGDIIYIIYLTRNYLDSEV